METVFNLFRLREAQSTSQPGVVFALQTEQALKQRGCMLERCYITQQLQR
jgi:hypothetical protein